MNLIHFGAIESLRDVELSPVDEQRPHKPIGKGLLWTSPKGSHHSWKRWCDAEDFGIGRTRYEITLASQARLRVVDGLDDLIELHREYPKKISYGEALDWHRIVTDYDAMWLTENGEPTTRFTTPTLYGWDCETVLVFRAASFCQIVSAPPASPHTNTQTPD